MTRKKQLDYFILSEALKYINEEEQDFMALDSNVQDESIEQAETRLKEKTEEIKQLDTRKKMHQSAISKMIDPTDRSIETLQTKKYDEQLKNAKKEESDLKNKINDLKKAKSDSEKLRIQREKEAKGMGTEIKEALTKLPVAQSQIPQKPQQTQPKPEKREMVVRFDTNTPSPFTVKFSSRGFIVGNTRLSFELIQKAISKQFSITLKTGLILTPVKMQKILKYKDRY
jgi:DNA repair ATPase RecN